MGHGSRVARRLAVAALSIAGCAQRAAQTPSPTTAASTVASTVASRAPARTLAAGDPASDSAPAIQSALDAAGASGGGTVELGSGTFAIRRALRIPSRVTLRGAGSGRTRVVLVALDTRLPDNPKECPPSTPRPGIPSVAIYNGAQGLVRQVRPYYPATGTCGDTVVPPMPPDRDVVLASLTVDCNTRALWPGPRQEAGNGNMACASFDGVIGLTLDDVVIHDAAIDGVALGWSEGVYDFAILRSRVEGSGRFAIGWITAARGRIADSVLDGNAAGGIDLEPIGAFGDSGVAHDVTVEDVRIVGTARRPELAFGRDDGIALCFSRAGVTRGIHVERVLMEDLRGVAMRLAWGGDYDDIRIGIDARRVAIGGVFSSLHGHGSATIEGRFEDVGGEPGVLGAAVGLGGDERGWRVGPLSIRQEPAWANASAVVLGARVRDVVLRDIDLRLGCNPDHSVCRKTRLVTQTGQRAPDDAKWPMRTAVHPSVRIERCAMHAEPPRAD
jgi:hypothetical protein